MIGGSEPSGADGLRLIDVARASGAETPAKSHGGRGEEPSRVVLIKAHGPSVHFSLKFPVLPWGQSRTSADLKTEFCRIRSIMYRLLSAEKP